MLIPLAASEGGKKEWALVELQGKIEPQRDVDLQESLAVGTMQLSKNEDVVQLQIGYHVLEGKRIPLKKPMAIMDKVQETDSEGHSQTVCKVVGVLRHKYLFKTRPRALISRPHGRR
ncbi:chromosome transmission fidelity protein 8 [Scenedesmus sp. NREL 46B-D3]|nr:chromosome transmission fidelity protein 8 [Scenedesmus sp. NREL 46B-D3]